ncbi:hypothetical protein Sjap_002314 [Stephania japonica]|uniref:Uncharacterized protein n=1 Tax=Stephania japonica TaxID=461633 RepID=A0AAP0KNF5_9MAGN
MYEVKGEGQKGHLMLYIQTVSKKKKKPIHTLFIFSFDENRRPLLLFHLDLFTTPLTVSLSPSPFHSRCSLSISLPTLVVSHALGHSLPLGLTSLTLSAVSSPGWNSHHHRLRHRAGLDNWSAV